MVLTLALALVSPAVLASGDVGKSGYKPTVSLGFYHSAAISEKGELFIWGPDRDGLKGHGNTPVPGISNVVSVSISQSHAAAITADGSLYTWGNNYYGQLGLGNSGDGTDRAAPTKVPGLSNVVAVSLGGNHSAAITADGSLYTWGEHYSGKLGLGDEIWDFVTTPTKVSGISNVVAISMGNSSSAAITANGDLYTWGGNYERQLGQGPLAGDSDMYVPTKVEALSNVAVVSMGESISAAVTSDGSLYTWGGNNTQGELGLGDSTDRVSTPTKVTGLSNVTAVSMGSNHGAAITSDGSLYTWGNNSYGQLGFGDTTTRKTPTKVPGLSNVASVSVLMMFSAALTSSGDLYIWGRNNYGQLGDGSTTDRTSPVKRMSNMKLPGGSTTTPTPPPPPPPSAGLVAKPTASTVLVNGENVAFDAYNIEGNNYFKLRDLAFILNGTEKQFEVGWDAANNAITLTSGKAYTTVGGEMTGKGTGDKRPTPTVSKIYLDGKEVLFTA